MQGNRRALALLLVTLLSTAGGAGCTQVRGAETAAAGALISPEQEQEIGDQIQKELAGQVRFVTDPVVVRYVEAVAAPVFAAVNQGGYAYQPRDLNIIDDPKTVNAFAIPGGHVYVESGLLLAIDDDAELAGVLAHEAGHVALDHAGRRMVEAFGLQELAAIALGRNPVAVAQIGASIAANGLLLVNSRQDETEADRFGARLASAANYDPQGIVRFLGKLEKLESGHAPPVWLSDHPTSETRIRDLQGYIAKNGLTGQVTNRADLRSMKSRLTEAPEPR